MAFYNGKEIIFSPRLNVASAVGTIPITENGEYDVSKYAQANVNVPLPVGSIEITSNGVVDVTEYEEAVVNVPMPEKTYEDGYNEGYDFGYEDGLADGRAEGGGGETISMLPNNLASIGEYAYENCGLTGKLIIPETVTEILSESFGSNAGLTEVVFKGTPQFVAVDAFIFCDGITTIKVPWLEDDVSNAPWGAENATIVYEYTEVLNND